MSEKSKGLSITSDYLEKLLTSREKSNIVSELQFEINII